MERSSTGMVQEAKIVVGLDFGTSYSGFAFALTKNPDGTVYTFYEWPMQAQSEGLSYCKTPTALLYADAACATSTNPEPFELQEWGWPALVKYNKSVTAQEPGPTASPGFDFEVVDDFESESDPKPCAHLLTLFKLHLATDMAWENYAPSLPAGMKVRRAVSDFLSEMAKFVLMEVKNRVGPHITVDDLQWCLTVPAIWNEDAKREMRLCAEAAGLVQGPLSKGTGSPHPLKLFIEPEAASVYCQQKLTQWSWRKGDKFLVVDCGGGTVDLVLHEKLGSTPTLEVREVQASSGDFCGGARVDENFICFMRRKISCFSEFEKQHPSTMQAFRRTWEDIKIDFNGENGPWYVPLPSALETMCEAQGSNGADEVEVSNADMKSMFDPVVSRILELMEEKMAREIPYAVVVVGGFSQSPYLMKRIREAFGGRVEHIESPADPGSAVCCGAVTMGLRSDIVVSRISKKTYGFRQAVPFVHGVHSEYFKVEGEAGKFYCNNVFGKYVGKGDEVRPDESVVNTYFPISESQSELVIDLYSSDSASVRFITDPRCRKEGTFTVGIRTQEDLGFKPKVEVSMFFGRTDIEVAAVGKNFDCEKKLLPVKFEWNGIF